jgi:hypothetical protein
MAIAHAVTVVDRVLTEQNQVLTGPRVRKT